MSKTGFLAAIAVAALCGSAQAADKEFYLGASIGQANIEDDFDEPEDVNDFDADDTDLAWGVGGQFRLGSAAFRLEYENFDFGDKADMISVGFSWTVV